MAGAFYTAAGGLRNQQIKMDAIASNIANINTAGYKASSTIFAELLSQTLRGASAPQGAFGGLNPMQIGFGATVAAIHTLMGQSTLENTNRSTDFALSGQGLFVITDGQQRLFTRAGDFGIDASGTLVSSGGYKIQGFNQLSPDGFSISDSSEIGNIIIQFGQKLAAKPTTEVTFESNLNASSDRYGSVDKTSLSFGQTGITTAAGAVAPYAVAVGQTAVDATTYVDPSDIIINGNTVSLAGLTGATSLALAQQIADAINADTTVNQIVQATVRNVNNEGFLVLQAIRDGQQFTVDGSTATPYIGFPAGVITYTPPSIPGDFLVGDHQITVTESKAAAATTSQAVGVGVNAPQLTGTFEINGVTVNLDGTGTGISFSDTGTSAGNAARIAEIINATPGVDVVATANANGTLNITQKLKGEANIFAFDNPNFVDLFDRLGFTSITDGDGTPGNPITVNNGINARIEDVFTSTSSGSSLMRFVEDITTAGTSSELSNIQTVIAGQTANFPLMPGIILSIDQLSAGRAFLRTNTATVHSTSKVVYDTLGNPHELTLKFTHIGNNYWNWEAFLPNEPHLVLTNNFGALQFDTSGLVATPNPTSPIAFTGEGAEANEINLVFDGGGKAINGVTQFTGETTTTARNQDGYPMGILTDFEVEANGTITGFFTNGQRRPIAQLAIATFTNPEGLSRVGDTTFRETANSGSAVMRRANTEGAGSVFGGFLEQSNVDLAVEFTNLILAQRGLQANSRVFSAQDEVLTEIVNLKR
jgi:flagellar hook protein FlgE